MIINSKDADSNPRENLFLDNENLSTSTPRDIYDASIKLLVASFFDCLETSFPYKF